MEKPETNKVQIFIIVILSLLVVGLGVNWVYSKIINKDNDANNNGTENKDDNIAKLNEELKEMYAIASKIDGLYAEVGNNKEVLLTKYTEDFSCNNYQYKDMKIYCYYWGEQDSTYGIKEDKAVLYTIDLTLDNYSAKKEYEFSTNDLYIMQMEYYNDSIYFIGFSMQKRTYGLYSINILNNNQTELIKYDNSNNRGLIHGIEGFKIDTKNNKIYYNYSDADNESENILYAIDLDGKNREVIDKYANYYFLKINDNKIIYQTFNSVEKKFIVKEYDFNSKSKREIENIKLGSFHNLNGIYVYVNHKEDKIVIEKNRQKQEIILPENYTKPKVSGGVYLSPVKDSHLSSNYNLIIFIYDFDKVGNGPDLYEPDLLKLNVKTGEYEIIQEYSDEFVEQITETRYLYIK